MERRRMLRKQELRKAQILTLAGMKFTINLLLITLLIILYTKSFIPGLIARNIDLTFRSDLVKLLTIHTIIATLLGCTSFVVTSRIYEFIVDKLRKGRKLKKSTWERLAILMTGLVVVSMVVSAYALNVVLLPH